MAACHSRLSSVAGSVSSDIDVSNRASRRTTSSAPTGTASRAPAPLTPPRTREHFEVHAVVRAEHVLDRPPQRVRRWGRHDLLGSLRGGARVLEVVEDEGHGAGVQLLVPTTFVIRVP
jgi:hypothetical protein